MSLRQRSLKMVSAALPLGIALGTACSAAPVAQMQPSPLAVVSAPAAPSASPAATPARTYVRGDTATPMLQSLLEGQLSALSPDGALVAIGRAGVAFYDIDRKEVVGVTPLDVDVQGMEWLDDATLLVTSENDLVLLDGRTGARRAVVRVVYKGTIRRPEGLAVVRAKGEGAEVVLVTDPTRVLATIAKVDSTDGVVGLSGGAFLLYGYDHLTAYERDGTVRWTRTHGDEHHSSAPPPVRCEGERCVVHLVEGGHWTVLAASDGATLAYTDVDDVASVRFDGGDYRSGNKLMRLVVGQTPTRLEHDVPGKLLGASDDGRFFAWDDAGGTRVDDIKTATRSRLPLLIQPLWANGVVRLGRTSDALYDLTGSGDPVPIMDLKSGKYSTVAFEEGRLKAVCSNQSEASIAVGSAPKRDSVDLDYTASEITSADGSLKATVDGSTSTVTLVELDAHGAATGKPKLLDAKGVPTQIAFSHSGDKLYVAQHLRIAGMSHHVDPDACVRVFDTKTGALLHSINGEGFQLGGGGARLVIEADLSGKDEATCFYDPKTFKKIECVAGPANQITLSASGGYAHIAPGDNGGLGGQLYWPHAFLEKLDTKTRASTRTYPGRAAFDSRDRWFAFAPASEYTFTGEIDLVDLPKAFGSGSEVREEAKSHIDLAVPAGRFQFVSDEVIFAGTDDGFGEFYRLRDGRTLRVRAAAEGAECRLVAVAEDGHFAGDPGKSMRLRWGDDLRTSALSSDASEIERLRDDHLVEAFVK